MTRLIPTPDFESYSMDFLLTAASMTAGFGTVPSVEK